MTITLYTKPSCVQCTASKRALKKHGLEFTEIDLLADPTAMETVKALGYQQAPVIFAGGDHWSGYRPDRIKELAQAKAQNTVSQEVSA